MVIGILSLKLGFKKAEKPFPQIKLHTFIIFIYCFSKFKLIGLILLAVVDRRLSLIALY